MNLEKWIRAQRTCEHVFYDLASNMFPRLFPTVTRSLRIKNPVKASFDFSWTTILQPWSKARAREWNGRKEGSRWVAFRVWCKYHFNEELNFGQNCPFLVIHKSWRYKESTCFQQELRSITESSLKTKQCALEAEKYHSRVQLINPNKCQRRSTEQWLIICFRLRCFNICF